MTFITKLLLLILLLFVIISIIRERKVLSNMKISTKFTKPMIKKVWSYWDGATRPEIITRCIDSWHTYLPDWEINILNEEALVKYNMEKPASYDSLTPTTKSDVIRLWFLYKYGGVWMDASVLLLENLDWLEAYSQWPYYGFVLRRFPYVESWFIFAPKAGEQFILSWLRTLNSILDTEIYENHVAYTKPCQKNNNYFMVYQAFCSEIESKPIYTKMFKDIPFGQAGKHLYNPLIPISAHKRLIKFSKSGRKMYKNVYFPLIYCYFGLIVGIVILAVLYLKKK